MGIHRTLPRTCCHDVLVQESVCSRTYERLGSVPQSNFSTYEFSSLPPADAERGTERSFVRKLCTEFREVQELHSVCFVRGVAKRRQQTCSIKTCMGVDMGGRILPC